MPTIEDTLAGLEANGLLHHLREAQCGMEKEALRVDTEGRLSQRPHPVALGSALTHPAITTDFSEALLELITPVFRSPDATLDCLQDLMVFTQGGIRDEVMWATSMPCHLPPDNEIPIAHYGTSNSGLMRNVYRRGLSWRYGRAMQAIAGIHYNFSPADEFWEAWQDQCDNLDDPHDFRSEHYFRLIRNFRRNVWLLVYLFGASPAVCQSFLQGREHELQSFTAETLYLPWATSLRMSGLGYQNNMQKVVNICYNTLDAYLVSLRHATSTPHPEFTRLGVQVNGDYRQLNDNILQIENEYYSTVRPKRTVRRGERPLRALADRGVEYVEVRCLDINPYTPLGADAEQAHLLHVFLWHCLLADSPPIDDDECARISENLRRTVYRGREPGLQLLTASSTESLADLAHGLLDQMETVGAALDSGGDSAAGESIRAMRTRASHPETTPSGRVVEDMRRLNISHVEFGMDASRRYADELRAASPAPAQRAQWQAEVEQSLAAQADLEADTSTTFEEYLAAYFRQ